ncbi:MAG: DinB family protein [Trueperaceae bacterium]
MADRRLEESLRHIHPPKGARSWHGGPTVLGALRGVTPEAASWKPYPDRHSIWELALHVAYWNYRVLARISEELDFPRSPSDWPAVPEPADASAWQEDRRFVKEWHDRLVAGLESLDDHRLDEKAGNTETYVADIVTGVLLHDTYHAGQIQLMKRLARSAGIGE